MKNTIKLFEIKFKRRILDYKYKILFLAYIYFRYISFFIKILIGIILFFNEFI